MNTAYWLTIIWGTLAILATCFTNGRNAAVVWLLIAAAALSGLLGVAVQYNII